MNPITNRVLMTGGGGRIGSQLKRAMLDKHKVVELKRGAPSTEDNHIKVLDPTSLTAQDWKKLMEDNGINMVFNLAAQSSGEVKSMIAVNVNMPKALAEACKDLQIPMIHTCSHSAELQGLNLTDHPYATTKRMAAEVLKENPNVVIARLGAVLGGESDVPVCTDAAISTWSPFIALPASGGETEFHPIDEKTTIETLAKIADHLSDPTKANEPLPKVIEIVGKEVSLEAFLKMVNPRAIGSIKLPDRLLNLLASVVNKGVFTKEFMNITKLIEKPGEQKTDASGHKPDTSGMEKLGVTIPSQQEVADAARKQLSLVKSTTIVSKALFDTVNTNIKETAPKGLWPPNFLEMTQKMKTQFNKLYSSIDDSKQ